MEITKEGRQRLEAKIAELKQQLSVATAMGQHQVDSDGNRFGYDPSFYQESARKSEIARNIKDLEDAIANSVLVEEFSGDDETVKLRSTVKVMLYYNNEDPMEATFYIKETEVDPVEEGERAISTGSPIGKAIYNHRVGDEVAASIPNGSVKIVILEVVNAKTRR